MAILCFLSRAIYYLLIKINKTFIQNHFQKYISVVLYFILSGTILAIAQNDPFVVVVMVKNEETVIEKTLEPFVKEGINSFLIFDTGSTDNTIETVKLFFKKNNINQGLIFQESFIDFATSRNRALDLAEENFPDATFFLMPDAEWYLHNVKGLIEFCNQMKHDSCKCYLIRVVNYGIDFTISRLIRSKANARFAGAVHEVVITDTYKKVPADIYFELGVSKAGIEKSRNRWQRDLILLLKTYTENPSDSRNLFYLAQTYECLEDFVNAYKYYEIRSRQNGWFEENYETFYRLGRVTDILSKTDSQYTWHMAQDYYFKAHGILPHRAEPLVKIAEHYWPDSAPPENIALCYLFAKRAYELPYPEHDLLFIDPDAYHLRRYELLSKCAWHLGDFDLGEIATRKALAYKEIPYLLRNLACYLEVKNKKTTI